MMGSGDLRGQLQHPGESGGSSWEAGIQSAASGLPATPTEWPPVASADSHVPGAPVTFLPPGPSPLESSGAGLCKDDGGRF